MKIAKNYIRECDYFEALKKESPVVYTSLKEKIRNFQKSSVETLFKPRVIELMKHFESIRSVP